jgi:hypothetical protein
VDWLVVIVFIGIGFAPILIFVLRRDPAVAVVRRRRGILTWAGVLVIAGILMMIVVLPLAEAFATGPAVNPAALAFLLAVLCGAFSFTLLAVELIWTALSPDGGQGTPPPGRHPEPR